MHQAKPCVVLALAMLMVAAAVCLQAAQALAAGSPIRINHCFVTEPKPLSKNASGTQIDYVNVSSKTAKSVTFAVGYRNAASHYVRKVTDEGSFDPGTPIDHHFSLYSDVTYAGKQTTSCSAIKVIFSDATVWTP